MNGDVDLSLFALGTGPEQGVIDEWSAAQGVNTFPTRPEGPTAQWSEAFGFGSPVVGASTLMPGEPETTIDWSQTLARAGTFVGGLVKTAGDISDALTGRPTAAARTTQATSTRMSMMPVLLIGGVILAAIVFGGKR